MAAIINTRRGQWVAEKAPRCAGWQVRNLNGGDPHWAANKTAAIATMNRLAALDGLRRSNERLAAAAGK